MNNLWKMHAPLMEEAGNEGGGATPVQTAEPTKAEPTKTETENAEPTKDDPTKTGSANAEPTKDEPTKDEQKSPIENLLDDDPGPTKDDAKAEGEWKEPTDEEKKAFVDTMKKIDIGENVTWDDPLLEKIAPSVMELAKGDPAKTEKLVKAYTEFRQAEAKAFNENRDNFLRSQIDECRRELGQDLKQTVELAKAGGRHVFGDELWKIMRGVPEFANNVKIIKRLAMFGRSVKDDPGVIKKETASVPAERDWRENMYGKHN